MKYTSNLPYQIMPARRMGHTKIEGNVYNMGKVSQLVEVQTTELGYA